MIEAEAGIGPSDTLTIPVELPQGFYIIIFPQSNQKFGIVSMPAYRDAPDPFFGIDSALTSIRIDNTLRESLIKTLKRSGIGIARERLFWHQISLARNTWDWQTPFRFDETRNLYKKHGIHVLELFHDTPDWMADNNKSPYPANLPEAAASWSIIGNRWHSLWGALEIWNEPELPKFGGDLPADQYVAMVKTLDYSFFRINSTLPIGGGAFTEFCPDTYLETCAQNGLLNHIDFVSIHSFMPPENLPPLIEKYRLLLAKYNRSNLPIWITEAGAWAKECTQRSLFNKHIQLTRCAQAKARDICIKAVESRASGIEKFFPFILIPFQESDHYHGLVSEQYTPNRSMAAYCQTIKALAHTRYAGRLSLNDNTSISNRVFLKDEKCIIVIHTTEPSPQAEVHLPIPVLQIEGIDGRSLQINGAGNIPIPDGITYVFTTVDHIQNRLIPAEKAITGRNTSSRPSPLIIQHLADKNDAKASVNGYTLLKDTAQWTIPVRLNNLSSTPQALSLTVNTISGTGMRKSKHPQLIDIAPNNCKDVAVTVDLKDLGGAFTIHISGHSQNTPDPTPLVCNAMVQK